MSRPRIAILASGEGTTAETFIRASHDEQINAMVDLVICNLPEAGIISRIKRLNTELGLDIECVVIGRKNYPAKTNENVEQGSQTEAEESAILKTLANRNLDLICLMGYLKRIGSRLVKKYGAQSEHISPYQAMMLNTHPGLLPDSKGLWGRHVQEFVLNNKLPFSGQSLIVVAEDYDAGTVVSEHKVKVEPGDTPDSLFARVQSTEKKYLPSDVDAFIKNRQNYIHKSGETSER